MSDHAFRCGRPRAKQQLAAMKARGCRRRLCGAARLTVPRRLNSKILLRSVHARDPLPPLPPRTMQRRAGPRTADSSDRAWCPRARRERSIAWESDHVGDPSSRLSSDVSL